MTTPGFARVPARPASPARRILAQARFDAAVLLRNGEQLLVLIVLPAIALIAATVSSVPAIDSPRRIDVVAPGILALAVISAAFTGQAITTAFDRRYGVLRLLGTTPLGRAGLLGGRVIAVLLVEIVQLLVLGGIALALGWRPVAAGIVAAGLAAVLGTIAFVALAIVVGGTLRPEATLAVANLLWVLFLGAGVVLPSSVYGDPWGGILSLLPSTALADALRDSLGSGTLDLGGLGSPLPILVGWTVVFVVAATRLFRWDE